VAVISASTSSLAYSTPSMLERTHAPSHLCEVRDGARSLPDLRHLPVILSSRSLIARQLTSTSALLGDPRSNEAEKHTSNDDCNSESDESEPKPLKVRHVMT